MKKQKRLFYILAFFVILTPFVYQNQYLQADETDYYTRIQKGLQYFQKVYSQVQSHYVEEIDPYEFVKAGIEGMLGALDPYTVFIEQEGDTRLRIITTGKYGGLGMEIGMRNDRVTVISPMDNSPAEKAGVLAGDIIEQIDGEDVSDLSLEKISQNLRGPIGSEVELTISRPSYSGKIMITIERAEITIEDVNYADFVSPGVAYIRLTGFTDKAGAELRQAIMNLQQNATIDALVLDLRGNSGGLLEAAVDVLGIFLPKDTKVVSTKGFRDGEHSFATHTEPLLVETPLAVLVDNGSASASEIVAGALQDLDRAIIVGTKTFGKGLVQKVYNIDKNNSTKIKITTAKYYIPSGRCVQKQDYTEDNAIFFTKENDTMITESPKSIFYTVNRRTVYEKGGITPDRIIDRKDMPLVVSELWRQSVPFNFAVQYHQKHPELSDEIEVTDNIFKQFVLYLQSINFDYKIEGENEVDSFLEIAYQAKLDQQIIKSGESLLKELNGLKKEDIEKNKDQISHLLLTELAEKYYGNKARIQYGLKNDTQLKETIDVILNANEYKKILAIK